MSWTEFVYEDLSVFLWPDHSFLLILFFLLVFSLVFFVFLSFKFFGQLLSVFFEGLPGVCLNQFVSALIALTMLGFLLGFLGGGEPMSWRND